MAWKCQTKNQDEADIWEAGVEKTPLCFKAVFDAFATFYKEEVINKMAENNISNTNSTFCSGHIFSRETKMMHIKLTSDVKAHYLAHFKKHI